MDHPSDLASSGDKYLAVTAALTSEEYAKALRGLQTLTRALEDAVEIWTSGYWIEKSTTPELENLKQRTFQEMEPAVDVLSRSNVSFDWSQLATTYAGLALSMSAHESAAQKAFFETLRPEDFESPQPTNAQGEDFGSITLQELANDQTLRMLMGCALHGGSVAYSLAGLLRSARPSLPAEAMQRLPVQRIMNEWVRPYADLRAGVEVPRTALRRAAGLEIELAIRQSDADVRTVNGNFREVALGLRLHGMTLISNQLISNHLSEEVGDAITVASTLQQSIRADLRMIDAAKSLTGGFSGPVIGAGLN